ncbi:MAG: glycosyltransferase family 4 protein [Clostridiales Family XIII bacterium]|jgi:glycosyltransferase involved in cell wall biosynthesis|nr:glycosyltransferase family 4 protein [Clostridiales Family XIII bacterium]
MTDLLMIAHFTILPSENGNSRFHTILSMLAETGGYRAELITSGFFHARKSQRERESPAYEALPYRLTLLPEPAYARNVSLKRIRSHATFAQNVKRYLHTREKPDIVYCAIPSLSVAHAVARWCENNELCLILDVQDLWPEAFMMTFRVPVLRHLAFWPMQKRADSIYGSADKILAVSETYRDRALRVNEKDPDGLSVYLGTDLAQFDRCGRDSRESGPDGGLRIAYVGTLGHSYDLSIIIEAIALLPPENRECVTFVVMGDGPLRAEFERKAKEAGIRAEFTGLLPYPDMVRKLCACDIAVNPIAKNAAQSIINKVADYAAAGLPVVNTQQNAEYRDLLSTRRAGIHCTHDAAEIASALHALIRDPKLRRECGDNNRKLAEERFDRGKTYGEIIELIDRCARERRKA